MVVDYCTWRRLEGVRLWSINDSECCSVIGSRDLVCLICGVDGGWLVDEFNELMNVLCCRPHFLMDLVRVTLACGLEKWACQ